MKPHFNRILTYYSIEINAWDCILQTCEICHLLEVT